jgi:hypothetical protein
MGRDFALHSAILSLFVTTGRDPTIHADLSATWIAGSSPAMTNRIGYDRRDNRQAVGSPRCVLGAQIRNWIAALFVFPELMQETLPHRAVSDVSDKRRPRIFGMLTANLPPGQDIAGAVFVFQQDHLQHGAQPKLNLVSPEILPIFDMLKSY